MTMTVFGYLILIIIDCYDFISISVFSSVLVLIEKIYQTLKTVFDHISKHLEGRQKYSVARCIFDCLLSVCNVVKHSLECLICYRKDFSI